MPESNYTVDEWSSGKKQVFRFWFIFLLFYIFVNPNNVAPFFYIIQRFIRQPFYYLIDRLGDVILRVPGPLSASNQNATDTIFSYLVVLFTICIACIGSVVWMFIDKKSTNYNKANEAFIIILRYYLGVTWIAYGTVKLIHHQFPELTPITLLRTYGNSLPRELAWNFMGYSRGFNYFIGIGEYVIGALLFFRRTYTIGNLIGIGALINVLAFNYYFDDNVKLLSTILMIMSLLLLSKDGKHLIDFFFRNKAVSLETKPFYRFNTKGKNVSLNIVKSGLIAFVIFWDIYTYSAKSKELGITGKKAPLYGVYEVETFVVNQDTLKPLTTDTNRWSKLVISNIPGKAAIVGMNNYVLYFTIRPDTIKKTIVLMAEDDTTARYSLAYNLKDSVMQLQGKYRNDSLRVQLKQVNLDSFPLLKHKFSWIVKRKNGSRDKIN